MIFSCFPSFFTKVQYNRPVAIGCFFPAKFLKRLLLNVFHRISLNNFLEQLKSENLQMFLQKGVASHGYCLNFFRM